MTSHIIAPFTVQMSRIRKFLSLFLLSFLVLHSILYFSGLVILHTVPRQERKRKSIAGKSCVKNHLVKQFSLSQHTLFPFFNHCERCWYSLVGLNIIYSSNIDFSWIEKRKRKTLTLMFDAKRKNERKKTRKKEFNKFPKCARKEECREGGRNPRPLLSAS